MAVAATYVVQANTIHGVPAAGTDAVYLLTIGGAPVAQAGSGFYLSHGGLVTSLILWSATNTTLRDNVDAALEVLASLGVGGVTTAVGTMTAGVGTLTITMAGANAKKAVAPILAHKNVMAGAAPTVTMGETTPGVNAYGIGLPLDTVVVNATTGLGYKNTGTALSPVWTAF